MDSLPLLVIDQIILLVFSKNINEWNNLCSINSVLNNRKKKAVYYSFDKQTRCMIDDIDNMSLKSMHNNMSKYSELIEDKLVKRYLINCTNFKDKQSMISFVYPKFRKKILDV